MARKLLFVLGLATGALQAQTPKPSVVSVSASARWEAWVGCWAPDGTGATQTNALTCIVPSADNAGVDRLSIADGAVTKRETLIADGRPRTVEQDGCKGEQNVSFAKTGSRVYLNGHFTCAGGSDVATSSLYAIVNGDWLDAEQVSSGGGTITRETRYRDAGVPASLPKNVVRALQGRGMLTTAARAAASAAPTFADVSDASSFVDSSLVRAWLEQNGARLGGTTVFAPATGAYSYGGGGNVFYGPNYPPGVVATPPGTMPPIPAENNSVDDSYPLTYGYPFAYGYPYYYGIWSGPMIYVPGPARPKVAKPWGLGTQPTAPPARRPAHPGIRR